MRPAPLGLVAILLMNSCQDACWMDDYTFVRQGEHVTVYGYGVTEADACAGSFDALEVHVATVKDLLWVDESESYEYHWLSDSDWGKFVPCSHGFACENPNLGGGAFSRLYPDRHESVHAVVRSFECPAFLNEGLAVYLGDPNPRVWYPLSDGVPKLLTSRELNSMVEYASAGHFVSFLVERYGWGAVVTLCMAIGLNGSAVDWELAVGRHLDKPLTQLLDEYRAFPVCSTQEFRARIVDCEAEPDFAFSEQAGAFSVQSDCSDSQSTNAAWGYVGNAVLTRHVYFPDERVVGVSVFAEGDSGTPATLLAEHCAPCSAGPQVVTLEEGQSIVKFSAGLHTVSIFFDKRDTILLDMVALNDHPVSDETLAGPEMVRK